METRRRLRILGIAVLSSVVALGPAGVAWAGSDPSAATVVTVANEAEYRAALAAASLDPSGPHSITLAADIVLDEAL